MDIFWLHEDLRGQGYGTQLLQMAEQEAIARGCHQAHLDTFEFQAPGFYEKHGYQCWGCWMVMAADLNGFIIASSWRRQTQNRAGGPEKE